MAGEPNDETRIKAAEAQARAIADALRLQQIDNRLAAHEARLNAINGSQEKTVAELQKLRLVIERVDRKQDTAAEVAKAVSENAEQAANKGVSTRTFVLGLASLVVGIATVGAATGHL